MLRHSAVLASLYLMTGACGQMPGIAPSVAAPSVGTSVDAAPPSPSPAQGGLDALPVAPAAPVAPTVTPAVAVSGTLASQSFSTIDRGIFALYRDARGRPTLLLVLSDDANICASFADKTMPAGLFEIDLQLLSYNEKASRFEAPGPGAYALSLAGSGAQAAVGAIGAYGQTCHNTLDSSRRRATSGSVMMTEVSSQSIAGRFSLAAGRQDEQLTGTFTAASCAALTNYMERGAQRTCR